MIYSLCYRRIPAPFLKFAASNSLMVLINRVGANLMVNSLSYVPQYIFPVNYPNTQCGESSGCSVSVGLNSNFRSSQWLRSEKPYKISKSELYKLSNLEMDEFEFRSHLSRIAPYRKY